MRSSSSWSDSAATSPVVGSGCVNELINSSNSLIFRLYSSLSNCASYGLFSNKTVSNYSLSNCHTLTFIAFFRTRTALSCSRSNAIDVMVTYCDSGTNPLAHSVFNTRSEAERTNALTSCWRSPIKFNICKAVWRLISRNTGSLSCSFASVASLAVAATDCRRMTILARLRITPWYACSPAFAFSVVARWLVFSIKFPRDWIIARRSVYDSRSRSFNNRGK